MCISRKGKVWLECVECLEHMLSTRRVYVLCVDLHPRGSLIYLGLRVVHLVAFMRSVCLRLRYPVYSCEV